MKKIMEYTTQRYALYMHGTAECPRALTHTHTPTEPTNKKLDRNYENNNNSSPLVCYRCTRPSGHRLHRPYQRRHIAHSRSFDFDAAVGSCCLAPLLYFGDWLALCVRNRSMTRSSARHHWGGLHWTQHSFQQILSDRPHRSWCTAPSLELDKIIVIIKVNPLAQCVNYLRFGLHLAMMSEVNSNPYSSKKLASESAVAIFVPTRARLIYLFGCGTGKWKYACDLCALRPNENSSCRLFQSYVLARKATIRIQYGWRLLFVSFSSHFGLTIRHLCHVVSSLCRRLMFYSYWANVERLVAFGVMNSFNQQK